MKNMKERLSFEGVWHDGVNGLYKRISELPSGKFYDVGQILVCDFALFCIFVLNPHVFLLNL